MNRQEVGQTICVAFDELESFAADVLTCYDVPPDDAKVVGKILVEADRKGIESHGIGLVYKPSILIGSRKKTEIRLPIYHSLPTVQPLPYVTQIMVWEWWLPNGL
jgi:hypothetical protein